LQRAQDARERADDFRAMALDRIRGQQTDELPTGRRVYITPPPNVHFRSRWP
jgi:hypothetical protein